MKTATRDDQAKAYSTCKPDCTCKGSRHWPERATAFKASWDARDKEISDLELKEQNLIKNWAEAEKEIKRLREALKMILDPKRLRDVSKLASNPPQNAAVWDIQVIARAALKDANG